MQGTGVMAGGWGCAGRAAEDRNVSAPSHRAGPLQPAGILRPAGSRRPGPPDPPAIVDRPAPGALSRRRSRLARQASRRPGPSAYRIRQTQRPGRAAPNLSRPRELRSAAPYVPAQSNSCPPAHLRLRPAFIQVESARQGGGKAGGSRRAVDAVGGPAPQWTTAPPGSRSRLSPRGAGIAIPAATDRRFDLEEHGRHRQRSSSDWTSGRKLRRAGRPSRLDRIQAPGQIQVRRYSAQAGPRRRRGASVVCPLVPSPWRCGRGAADSPPSPRMASGPRNRLISPDPDAAERPEPRQPLRES